MAVFLERGINGAGFVPQPATGPVFADVPESGFAAANIEKFFADGITGGCGPNIFCPNESVTRAQMAVFLVRAFNLSGGGGGGSFVISTDVGPNGSIFPEIRTATAGEAGLEFVVTPADGFRVNTIGGCDNGANGVLGEIDGNTYITGVINANCTISVTFAPVESLAIVPEFPINGVNWNDYVVSTGGSASDVECTQNSEVCVHGGERRKVIVIGKNSCEDLLIAEELSGFIPGPGFGNFFNWECRLNSSGVAEFVSTGLADDMHFSGLLDFGSAAFGSNSIVVYYKGSLYGESQNTIDSTWNNVIEFTTLVSGGTRFLGQQGRIYLLTAAELTRPGTDNRGKFAFAANKVSLLIEGGAGLLGPPGGGDDSYVVESTGADFLWFEGQISAPENEVALRLDGSNFSTLRGVIASNANDGTNTNTSIDVGIELNNSHNNRLQYIHAHNNVFNGIRLNGSDDNVISHAIVELNGQDGILIRGNSRRNVVNDVTAGLNIESGVRIDSGSTDNSVTGLVAENNRSGLSLDSVGNNDFTDVTATSNASSGISLFISTFNTFDSIIATGNGNGNNNEGGVILIGASNNSFENVTASTNSGVGISLVVNQDNAGPDTYSDSNTFRTVTALGNISTDIVLQDSAGNTFTNVDALTCNVSPVAGNEMPRPSTNPGLDNNCNPVP
jgi:parallel beta-helix repeat protein